MKELCTCLYVSAWVSRVFFLPPLTPLTFCLCSLICTATNPPQKPPNNLAAQKSFFTPPPVYTYLLDLSLYSYSLSPPAFPFPIPLFLSQLHPGLCCRDYSVRYCKQHTWVKWPRSEERKDLCYNFPEQLEQFETTSNAMAPETVAVKLREKKSKENQKNFQELVSSNKYLP